MVACADVSKWILYELFFSVSWDEIRLLGDARDSRTVGHSVRDGASLRCRAVKIKT